MICITLRAHTLADALGIIERHRGHCDCYELRVDYLHGAPRESEEDGRGGLARSVIEKVALLPRMLKKIDVSAKLILTYRRRCDGGLYEGSEYQRLLTLSAILETIPGDSRYDYIDIESDIICADRVGGAGGAGRRGSADGAGTFTAGGNAAAATEAVAASEGEPADERILARIIEQAHRQGTGVIRSVHDMDGTRWGGSARTLYRLLVRTSDSVARSIDVAGGGAAVPESAGVAKVAVMVSSTGDLVNFYQALARFRKNYPQRQAIAIGMSEYGEPTRLLTNRYGLALSFCASEAGGQCPAGQLSFGDMHHLYRHDEITPRTGLFAIIGNPVKHSKSPMLHNGWFAKEAVDARYLPVRVDDVGNFMQLAELLPITGFSVTVPHKESIMPHLGSIDETARKIGACNTVVRTAQSTSGGGGSEWRGYNTDKAGFMYGLREGMSAADGTRPFPRRALVVGAGGAALAVAVALLEEGLELCIVNRTAERRKKLVQRLSAVFPDARITDLPLDPSVYEQAGQYGELIVQTTTVGMDVGGGEGGAQNSPLPGYPFSGSEIVYDLIYTPTITPLLHAAQQAGCTVINGEKMFIEQARQQFLLFRAALAPEKK